MAGTVYDYCVVGMGMIGSAAAYHLAAHDETKKILLIGPSEKDPCDTDIHSAHYDEARITKGSEPNPVWATLTMRAMATYRQLEQLTGIQFYEDMGFLCVADEKNEYFNKIVEAGRKLNIEHIILSNDKLSQRYPYLKCNNDEVGYLETMKAGIINPRKIVQAHQKAARLHGCEVVDDIVSKVHPLTADGCHTITTDSGKSFQARRVLLATGAFTHCRDLLPEGIKPRLTFRHDTTIFVELSAEDVSRMRGMPSLLILKDKPGDCIVLPPVKYPNGKYYLKLGYTEAIPPSMMTPAEITRWYKEGHSEEAAAVLKDMVRMCFPDLVDHPNHFYYDMTSFTPMDVPYVDLLSPSFGVAVGMCGRAGKNSDEIGVMAARMLVKGAWDYDLPAENFRFQQEPCSKQ